jgi:hypothetical protein
LALKLISKLRSGRAIEAEYACVPGIGNETMRSSAFAKITSLDSSLPAR